MFAAILLVGLTGLHCGAEAPGTRISCSAPNAMGAATLHVRAVLARYPGTTTQLVVARKTANRYHFVLSKQLRVPANGVLTFDIPVCRYDSGSYGFNLSLGSTEDLLVDGRFVWNKPRGPKC